MVGTVVLGQIVHGQEPAAVMAILRACVAVCAGLPESVALTVKVNVPAAEGVPEITPVVLPRVRPVGSDPAETDQE